MRIKQLGDKVARRLNSHLHANVSLRLYAVYGPGLKINLDWSRGFYQTVTQIVPHVRSPSSA